MLTLGIHQSLAKLIIGALVMVAAGALCLSVAVPLFDHAALLERLRAYHHNATEAAAAESPPVAAPA
ncbi:MAG: hypothetical protein AAFV26_03335 [Pseudomonadota bacterium]